MRQTWANYVCPNCWYAWDRCGQLRDIIKERRYLWCRAVALQQTQTWIVLEKWWNWWPLKMLLGMDGCGFEQESRLSNVYWVTSDNRNWRKTSRERANSFRRMFWNFFSATGFQDGNFFVVCNTVYKRLFFFRLVFQHTVKHPDVTGDSMFKFDRYISLQPLSNHSVHKAGSVEPAQKMGPFSVWKWDVNFHKSIKSMWRRVVWTWPSLNPEHLAELI